MTSPPARAAPFGDGSPRKHVMILAVAGISSDYPLPGDDGDYDIDRGD